MRPTSHNTAFVCATRKHPLLWVGVVGPWGKLGQCRNRRDWGLLLKTDLADSDDGSIVQSNLNGTITVATGGGGHNTYSAAQPTFSDDDIIKALRTHWSDSGETMWWTSSPVVLSDRRRGPAASGSPEGPPTRWA